MLPALAEWRMQLPVMFGLFEPKRTTARKGRLPRDRAGSPVWRDRACP